MAALKATERAVTIKGGGGVLRNLINIFRLLLLKLLRFETDALMSG